MEYTQRWMWSGWVGAECMWWRWILYAVGIDLENDILWWMEDDAVYFYLTYSTRAHGMSILKNSYGAQWTKHSKIFPMFVVYGLQATLSSSLACLWYKSLIPITCWNALPKYLHSQSLWTESKSNWIRSIVRPLVSLYSICVYWICNRVASEQLANNNCLWIPIGIIIGDECLFAHQSELSIQIALWVSLDKCRINSGNDLKEILKKPFKRDKYSFSST